ncbi:hypothetical protein SAMN05216570_0937 [Dyella sp. OK004]|uniref:hypothetical protein n=1 Tax=Dyella sp. OK004 TaxID=1855292 RepID=UPI0008E06B93|nr:hypothetical protein [Dyella sp. OK004]SFR94130.1 hypothetical protein SAMN05216570_0937 [Dyella sp. OK004]
MSSNNSINGNGSVSQFPSINTTIGAGSAAAGQSASVDQSKSWFEAMAKAWGNALDQQASKVTDLSSKVSDGGADQPSVMTQLTAESLKMQFLSTNAATSNNAVGQALETLGRKQ